MSTLKHVPLAEASIDDGDLLLFRRWGLISKYGRGIYSHAAMAAWWPGATVEIYAGERTLESTLMCLEVREWYGGRAVTLASQVKKNPGRIDVYKPLVSYKKRCLAVHAMLQKLGKPYSYADVVRAALAHVPMARMLLPADRRDTNGGESGRPEHCSGAIANAWRIGPHLDAVPNLADRATEPSDLARSLLFLYKCTLT